MPAIVFPARFDLPAIITPRMVRSYCHSIPSRRLMPAARGKSECEKEGNFSHLARKRSRFSGGENSLRACRATLGSARASRAGDGVPAIANFSLPRALQRGAAMSTRGRVRSPDGNRHAYFASNFRMK